MRRFITIFAFVLLFASCSSKQNQDTTMMYDDGRSKPVVIIAPIIDSTSLDYPWSLSDEFSSYIRNDLSQQGICIAHKDFQDFSYQQNPFENDLSWVKAAFPAEFVVFIEFVEHKQNPVYKRFDNPSEIKERSHNLDSIVRIRVLDIRKDKPQIVLQEALKDSYFISKNILQPDYNTYGWGTKQFATSPVGLAHNQLAKMIAERVGDYLMLAKTR